MKTVITLLASALLVVTNAKASDTNLQNTVSAQPRLTDKIKMAPVVDEPILFPQIEVSASPTERLLALIQEDNKIIESNPVEQSWLVFIDSSMTQIIEQNQQIIEDQTDLNVYPLFLDRTIEDQIAEDNAIIEAQL